MKNLEEDSYGFITDIDDVVGSEEYQQLPTEEKKKILLSIINTNNKKLKNNDEHRGELINVICDNGIVEKKSKHILEENEESYNVLSLDFLMQCDNYQDMIRCGLLPRKDKATYNKEMKNILLAVRNELDAYEVAKYEDEDDLFSEERQNCERLFSILLDYDEYEEEEIKIDVQSDFHVVYLPNSVRELDNSPIIKDVCKNCQKDILVRMINSIKEQEFKGLKRFTCHYLEFYELRANQQRVVFHFLMPNVVVVISAFTKKVDTNKRYRMELRNRVNRYRSVKDKLKKIIDSSSREQFFKLQDDIEQQFMNDIDKKLIKG